jgi:hypothetical protein
MPEAVPEREEQMERGNLSNVVMPRLLIVFEGAIGTLPGESVKAAEKLARKGKWGEVAGMYVLDKLIMAQMLRVVRNFGMNLDIVTWLGYDMAQEVERRMDEENIPVHGVFTSTPDMLARELAYMPDVAWVYDPDPSHVFTFGRRGVLLKSAAQIGRGN